MRAEASVGGIPNHAAVNSVDLLARSEAVSAAFVVGQP